MSDERNGSDCGAIRDLIPDFVASRLATDETDRVERHMRACADCRAELELVRTLLASRASVPDGLLERIVRDAVSGAVSGRRTPARTWWGISAAAIAALALGIGITSEDSAEPPLDVPGFVSEAEEGAIWLSDDGLLAGAPALDELSDEALLQLLDELTTGSSGGAA